MEETTCVKRYHRTRRLLGVASFLLDLLVLLVLLFTGWTINLRGAAQRWSEHPALAMLIYLLLFGLITKVVGLPLDFLRGFWLEHRYGLSNLTRRGWIKDQLKGFAVGGLLAALGIELVYGTMRRWPAHWWIIS